MSHVPAWAPTLHGVQFGLKVIHNLRTCGEAWNVGVQHFLEHDADYIMLTADDLVPLHEDYYLSAIASCKEYVLPAPRLFDADGTERDTDVNPPMMRVPFLPAWVARFIFPIPPMHYFSDEYVTERCKLNGWGCEYVQGYEFTHHWAQPGRHHDSSADRALYEQRKEEK